jgi:hypothetical protein
MAAALRTLVRLAGETELHRIPSEEACYRLSLGFVARVVCQTLKPFEDCLFACMNFPTSVLANEIPRSPLKYEAASPDTSAHRSPIMLPFHVHSGSADKRLSKRICCRVLLTRCPKLHLLFQSRKALACTPGPGRLNRLTIAKHDMCQILATLPQIVTRIAEYSPLEVPATA